VALSSNGSENATALMVTLGCQSDQLDTQAGLLNERQIVHMRRASLSVFNEAQYHDLEHVGIIVTGLVSRHSKGCYRAEG